MEMHAIAETIDFHRTHPDVTLEKHVRNRRIQLGIEASCKYKIYLDLKFWIRLRDVELGRNENQDSIQLLQLIKYLIDDGKVICPISQTVFFELMKQHDQETRLATVKLIDRLSAGITLIPHKERISQELFNAIYSQVGVKNLIPIDELVWTKLSYILGEFHPHASLFDLPEQLIIKKSFFDHMWGTTLTEMMKHLDFQSWVQPNWQEAADRLNLSNKKHSTEVRSYPQLYRVEFKDGLSLFQENLSYIFKKIDEIDYKEFDINSEILLKNERFRKFSRLVRTLHIGACCHAAVRWNQNRQLSGNDLLDFHHAEAAIGYCNLFLTEKPLKTLLAQNHLGLKSDFTCTIESSAEDALRVLDSM